MKLYFITGNKNKFTEANSIVSNLEQLDIDLPEIQEIDPRKIIEAKLGEASKHKKGDLIVEDTSLYFDCLNGLPGPLVKWFLDKLGVDGIYELVEKYNSFDAEARAMIGLKKGEEILYFEGVLKGTITKAKTDSVFGWDPIFTPKGYDKSFAEMSKEEKNQISHRKIAFKKLNDYLKK